MTEPQHAPTPEQRGAIEDRERDLFLSAGAGTGKTSVLVERFCDVVCATDGEDADASVENVLAFTFTERAADELKRRIRSELSDRANEAGEGSRGRRLRSLARDAESAWISTIHSFCQRVLGSNPVAAGLDPGFRVLDEPEAARVAVEAFDAAFQRFAAGEGDERFELAAAFRLSSLRDVVRGAYGELRARGHERPALPVVEPPEVGPAAAALHAAARDALAAATTVKRTSKVDGCLALLGDAIAATELGRPPTEDEVAGWSFSSKLLAGPEIDDYEAARATLERRMVEERFAHHYEYLGELVELYGEEYSRRKEQRSALDFEDLQLCARRLLRDRSDVRARYQRQFGHLMVDEFQDTNALQLAIISLLHLEDEVARNRLFTVGDELQSIYGFRHADVDVFRAQRDASRRAEDADAGVRPLTGNFRSSHDVLALVNRVGRSLFGTAYAELSVGAPAADGGVGEGPTAEVLVTEREGWDEGEAALEVSTDERAQVWRLAEARFLAERLRELHERGVPRGDMVVLLRSFSFVEAYEDALDAAGLAPHVVGGRGYWSKQQVADVRNLLGCVTNPLDEKAVFGALASPACGVAPDTLWLLREAAGGAPVWSAVRWLFGPPPEAADGSQPQAATPDEPDARSDWSAQAEEMGRHIPTDDRERLREFTSALLELRAAAPRLSLEDSINQAITVTGYDLALLMRRRGRRRMANVRKLMRLAREFEADEGCDLRAFLDYVASATDADAREAEAAVDAEGHDGVRLMTVHSAKGLEFPVVAVADLGRSLAAGAGPLLRVEPAGVDEPGGDDRSGGDSEAMRVGLRLARLGRKQTPIFDYPELQQRAVDREREEERRILHVAMTRAERRLILSGAVALEKLDRVPKPAEPLIAPVLRALGWEAGRGSVDLEPPPLRPGLEGQFAPVRVAVRTRAPGDEPSVAALPASDRAAASGLAAPAAPVSPSGPASPSGLASPSDPDLAALPDPDLAPLAAREGPPVRAVSYSALSLYERCGYRFYVERVLGLRPRLLPVSRSEAGERADEAHEADEIHPAADDDDGVATRYGLGRVVHELLERSARAGWATPAEDEAADLLRREGLTPDARHVARVEALVGRFLGAPIRAELAGARSLHPEAPFAFRAGGLLVRGEIDLLADLGDEILVLDYKSDALAGSAPADHLERYEVQRRIYALAALRRYGRPVRVAYVFLERPGEPVEQRFDEHEAVAITDEVAGLAGAVAAGRFTVTDSPERSLCLDCPARERLCVHGPELTLRDPASA